MATDLSQDPEIRKFITSPGFKALPIEKQRAAIKRITGTLPKDNTSEDVLASVVSGVAQSLPTQVGFAITNPIRNLLGMQSLSAQDFAYEPQTTAGKASGFVAGALPEMLIPGGTAIKGAKTGLAIAKTALRSGGAGAATGATRSALNDVNQGKLPNLTNLAKGAAIEGGLSAVGGAAVARAGQVLGKRAAAKAGGADGNAAPQVNAESAVPKAADIANPQAGMAQPVDQSPVLRVIQGGVKALAETTEAAPGVVPPKPKVSPEAIRVIGTEAENLRGSAATAVNEVAPQVLGDAPITARPTATPEQVAAANPAKFVNFGKFDLSADEKVNLGRLVQQAVAETGGNPKPKVTFKQIEAEAAAVDPQLVAILKPVAKGETLDPAVRLAANARVTDLTKQITALGEEISKGANTLAPDEILTKQQRLERMERDAKGLLDVLYPARSQDGRNLAFHRIIAQQSFAPDYWMSRAKKAGGGSIPDDVHARLLSILGRGNLAKEAGDEAAARTARMDLAKELVKLDRTPPLEVLMAFRKAGLLTGVKTQARNTLGNTAFQVMEEASRVPAAVADLVVSMATKQRSVAGANPAAVFRASQDAATKGVREAIQVMRYGATEEQLAALDMGRQVNSGNRLLDGYVNSVFRFLGAQDRIFKTFAYRRSLEAQATVIAKNTKDAPGDLVQQLVNKPTDSMAAQAIADAEFATFNQDNKLATAMSKFKSASPAISAGADLFMPFIKTPTNVVMRLFDYTGLPAALRTPATAAKVIKSALTQEEQAFYTSAVGRGAVGWSLMYLGYKLAEKGQMTGTYQKEAKNRNLAEVANRGPSAIKINGTWHQVGPLSPLGNLLALGATLHRDAEKDGELDPLTVAAIGAKTVGDQPFLQGAADLGEVGNDPGKAVPKVAASVAGSFVPTIISDVAGALDPVQRESKGISEGIQKRIPGDWQFGPFGGRNKLPAKVDALGREVPNDPLNAINPFLSKPAVEDTDPVIGELVRLGVGISKPGDKLKVRKADVKLTDDQQRELTKVVGKRERSKLERLISRPRYKKADDEEKQDLIEKVLQQERARGRRAYSKTLR